MQEQFSFNADELTYVKVKSNKQKKLKRIFLVSLLFIVVQFILLAFTFPYLKSVESRLVEQENEKLLDEYLVLQGKLKNAESKLSYLESRDDSLFRAIFEISPLSATMRHAGFGGTDKYASLENFEHSDLMINTAARLDALMSKTNVQDASYDELKKVLKKKQDYFESIPALRPLSLKNTRLSSFYGVRLHPILKRYKMHKGIDIAAPKGTLVYAPGNGKVVEIKRKGGYGKEIIIDHGYGYTTRFAHLSKILVYKGEKIKRGQIIAKVGSTGLSTAPHLHYEVRKNNKAINPENYFYADIDPEKYLDWKKGLLRK